MCEIDKNCLRFDVFLTTRQKAYETQPDATRFLASSTVNTLPLHTILLRPTLDHKTCPRPEVEIAPRGLIVEALRVLRGVLFESLM